MKLFGFVVVFSMIGSTLHKNITQLTDNVLKQTMKAKQLAGDHECTLYNSEGFDDPENVLRDFEILNYLNDKRILKEVTKQLGDINSILSNKTNTKLIRFYRKQTNLFEVCKTKYTLMYTPNRYPSFYESAICEKNQKAIEFSKNFDYNCHSISRLEINAVLHQCHNNRIRYIPVLSSRSVFCASLKSL